MSDRDTVVLLHGLGRTHLSLLVANLLLRREGYQPVGIFYPSRSGSIENLAGYVRKRLPATEGRIHFLTHSMGGLVARYLLRADRPKRLGRVVMLAPPNQGSQVAAKLRDLGFFRAVMGPAAQQLGSGRESLADLLGPVDFDLGVITGDKPVAQPTAGMIDGPSDGKVAVDEARVDGMADFLVVHRGHTFIMNDPEVIRQAVYFFATGRFDHPQLELRPPNPSELERLDELCFRSKAHWGYDTEFLERCRPVLRVEPERVAEGLVIVAYEGELPLGVAQLEIKDETAQLDLLFVEPEQMGRGVGSELFRWALQTAGERGAVRMRILSDPGARPFYERLGAVFVEDAPSDAVPERMLPMLEIDVGNGS